jgi:hypothetical protein
VPEFWDISSVESYEQFPSKIISSIHTPVVWKNPYTQRRYLGNMNNNIMRNFGMDVRLPHYKYHDEGFVYDSKSGLYLPDIMILR